MANITIISIGAMGLGIAKLLQANGHNVSTSLVGRTTHARALSASINPLPTDAQVVAHSDYILSILPPAEAQPLAERIIAACTSELSLRAEKTSPLYFLDLNAIAPRTAREIAKLFHATPNIRFIDGGIIGGPPRPKEGASQQADTGLGSTWTRPSLPLSGPHALTDAPVHGAALAEVLNTKYLGPDVGTASGLKCSFASLTKGLTALAIQSYTTAEAMGVLPELREHLEAYSPATRKLAEGGLVGMPGKAGRWVREMREIGLCMEEEGVWGGGTDIFGEVAEVYAKVDGTVKENGGTDGMESVEGVVEVLRVGLNPTREKE